MRKNLIVISIASLMISYSLLASAQQQDDSSGQGRHHGPPPEMTAEMKAAFDACLSETGVSKPVRGQKPSESDHQKMEACLKAKKDGSSQQQDPAQSS